MAIIDISIVPVGTDTPSVSHYVVELIRVLDNYKHKVNYKLTPMSTIIEGKLEDLFEVVLAIHEVPFQHGIFRVVTNIRIDDRRDKVVKMNEKVNNIEKRLNPEISSELSAKN